MAVPGRPRWLLIDVRDWLQVMPRELALRLGAIGSDPSQDPVAPANTVLRMDAASLALMRANRTHGAYTISARLARAATHVQLEFQHADGHAETFDEKRDVLDDPDDGLSDAFRAFVLYVLNTRASRLALDQQLDAVEEVRQAVDEDETRRRIIAEQDAQRLIQKQRRRSRKRSKKPPPDNDDYRTFGEERRAEGRAKRPWREAREPGASHRGTWPDYTDFVLPDGTRFVTSAAGSPNDPDDPKEAAIEGLWFDYALAPGADEDHEALTARYQPGAKMRLAMPGAALEATVDAIVGAYGYVGAKDRHGRVQLLGLGTPLCTALLNRAWKAGRFVK